MAQEIVKVEAISRNGILSNGAWLNFGKFSKTSPAAFEKGGLYTVDVTTSKTGGKFINSIVSGDVSPEPQGITSDTSVKQYDPHAKDAQIRYQGCWQAAVQSPYLGTKAWESEAELIAFVKRLADSGVAYITENLSVKSAN
jgi:hypothetical protein